MGVDGTILAWKRSRHLRRDAVARRGINEAGMQALEELTGVSRHDREASTMSTPSRPGTFLINRTDGDPETVATCYSTDELVGHARRCGPGRYHVDEHLDPSHRHRCRKFADVLHHPG